MIQSIRPFYFLLAILVCNNISAQEWKYEGPSDSKNWASDTWIDENGNSYHNITIGKISTENKGSIVSKHLLILDKHGSFNGIIKVQDCNNRAPIQPFSEGTFLVTGHNCNKSPVSRPDLRVLNKKGELLFQGEDLAFHHAMQVRTKDGYTIFSKNGSRSTMPNIEISDIDWNFSKSSHLLDLSEFNLPDMTIGVHGLIAPVQGSDGRWLIPANMGVKGKRNGRSNLWDFVFLTDGKNTQQKFPKKNNDLRIEGIQTYKDGYALMTYSNKNYKQGMILYFLNKNAKVEKSIPFEFTSNKFDEFLILNENIHILHSIQNPETRTNKHVMQTFDMKGKIKSERLLFDIGKRGRVWTMSMIPFDNQNILLSGSVISTDKERTAFIWKIDVEDAQKSKKAEGAKIEHDEYLSEIEGMEIENLNEDVLSVAAFPNPASIYINFEIDANEVGQGHYHLDVYSINGRRVHQANFKENFYELNIEHLTSGNYTFRIFNLENKKEYFTGKFIKAR